MKSPAENWFTQVEAGLSYLERVAAMPALNGNKWRIGTFRHYMPLLADMLKQMPPEMRVDARAFIARYKHLIDTYEAMA